MDYFVFRNTTVEPLFVDFDSKFSGYDDISNFPENAECYIWFYLVDIKFDVYSLISKIDDYYNKIELALSKISKNTPFLIFTLEKLHVNKWMESEYRIEESISNFNKKIVELSKNNPNIKIINFGDFISNYSQKELIDWKFYYLSGVLLNPKLKTDFSQWLKTKLNAINFKRKKSIILDLDNTLWGGILGETGPDGIELGNAYPGKAYSDVQEILLQFKKHGVILAICSKNNETDALEAWETNPFILLKKEDFSTYRINWNDKVNNIIDIAKELNIGMDSIVFIDDNPSERELVAQSLPEITVPELPKQPYLFVDFYTKIYQQYFSIYSLTEEDKNKTEQYQKRAENLKYQKSFASFEGYLNNLGLVLKIQYADKFSIPRIAQMTHKTNQFNLTTRRYLEKEIYDFLSNNYLIFSLSVKDKFGDYGITGVSIIEIKNSEAYIDTYLLSCRILGKGIEKAFIYFVINKLIDKGIKTIRSEYIPTSKNMQTEKFFDELGFSLKNSSDGRKSYIYEIKEKFQIQSCYQLEK
jgi:FkbH-like protein